MINNDNILNEVTRYYDNKRFNAQNKAYELNTKLNEDEKWVNKILEEHDILLKNVFYAFYTKKKTYIIKKSDIE